MARQVRHRPPDALTRAMRQHAPHLVRAGLETGLLSNFLTRALRARGVPIVCVDARHAKAALRVQINKTDANDAHGLAQVVRTGWFREVTIKSMDAQSLRLLLGVPPPKAALRSELGCP